MEGRLVMFEFLTVVGGLSILAGAIYALISLI
jgi:hypothetical protein